MASTPTRPLSQPQPMMQSSSAATIASAPSRTPAVEGADEVPSGVSSPGPAAAIAAIPRANGSIDQKTTQSTTAPMPNASTATRRESSGMRGTTTSSSTAATAIPKSEAPTKPL